MERLVKTLKNGMKIVFDCGRFDNWCVYIVNSDGGKNAPSDTEYFSDFRKVAEKYEGDKVYNDFVKIYDLTSNSVDPRVITQIDEIIETYNEDDKKLMEQWLSVVYAGMIAEENKHRAILKKRVKRLGMHQVLKLNYSPYDAANFSRGKKWRELDSVMKKLGF